MTAMVDWGLKTSYLSLFLARVTHPDITAMVACALKTSLS